MGLRYLVSPALHEWRAGLAQARHDAGLSQGDLHKLSGLPQAVVSRLENGNRISGVSFSESVYEKLQRLGEAVGRPAPVLVEVTVAAPKKPQGAKKAPKKPASRPVCVTAKWGDREWAQARMKLRDLPSGASALDKMLWGLVRDGRVAPTDACGIAKTLR